jgi:hypothetical protein
MTFLLKVYNLLAYDKWTACPHPDWVPGKGFKTDHCAAGCGAER